MPQEIRIAGFSLAFVTATAVFGGFTPAICTWLIEASGNRAVTRAVAVVLRPRSVFVQRGRCRLLTAAPATARVRRLRVIAMASGDRRTSRSGIVIRAASGNFLELYDYLVYVYFAGYIAKAYFPASSEFMSLMLAFGTYGVASIARPFGAVILGSYMDRVGRRKGSAGDAVIDGGWHGCRWRMTPGFASIGLLARR